MFSLVEQKFSTIGQRNRKGNWQSRSMPLAGGWEWQIKVLFFSLEHINSSTQSSDTNLGGREEESESNSFQSELDRNNRKQREQTATFFSESKNYWNGSLGRKMVKSHMLESYCEFLSESKTTSNFSTTFRDEFLWYHTFFA